MNERGNQRWRRQVVLAANPWLGTMWRALAMLLVLAAACERAPVDSAPPAAPDTLETAATLEQPEPPREVAPRDAVLPEAPLLRLASALAAPELLTLDNVTKPALPADREHAFRFEACEGMRFTAWCGGTQGDDAALFRVWLETGEARELLLEYRLEADMPGWQAVQADLGQHAGEEVRLVLEAVEDGARHYWGNPLLSAGDPAPAQPLVMLISLDTLRADHLSVYGYARETTPNLARFAREDAVLFENAYTPETWTLPSHMTMLTGLQPNQHRAAREQALPAEVPTLQALLQEEGYLSAAFTGHTWWFRPGAGFERGFDHYDNAPEMLRHIQDTRARLDAWLDLAHCAPQFLFFHSYDIHYKIPEDGDLPYEPGDPAHYHFLLPYLEQAPFQEPEKQALQASELLHAARAGEISFSTLEEETIAAGYDDAIRMVDQVLGEIFERLRDKGLYERALIIVTSDHGEGLGERGYYDHESVWEEEARVPMLVKFPDKAYAGTRHAGLVELADIFPTVLGALGLEAAPDLPGRDLRALLEGEAPAAEFVFVRNGGGELSVRNAEWKLHWRPYAAEPYLLFHLPTNPAELLDVHAAAHAEAAPLKQAAREFFQMDLPGWQIEVAAEADGPWRAALQVETEQPIIEALHIDLWGNARPLPVRDGNRIAVELGRAAPERITLRTAGAPDTLRVRVQSGRAFRFHAEETALPQTTEARLALHTAGEAIAKPEPADETSLPQVTIWYIPANHEF